VLVGDGRGPRCDLDRKCAPREGKPGEGAVEDAFLLAAGFAHTTHEDRSPLGVPCERSPAASPAIASPLHDLILVFGPDSSDITFKNRASLTAPQSC